VAEMSLSDRAAFVWDVAVGNKAQELEVIRKDLAEQKRMVDEMTRQTQAMPQGPARDAAQVIRNKAHQAWMPVVRQFNEAAAKHEEIRQAIISASVGLYDPGRVNTSLNLLPLAWIAGVAVACAAAIWALSALIDSIKSQNTQVRGYMDQFAGVLQAGGGVIEQFGNLMGKATWALLAVAGVAAGYVALTAWKKGKAVTGGQA